MAALLAVQSMSGLAKHRHMFLISRTCSSAEPCVGVAVQKGTWRTVVSHVQDVVARHAQRLLDLRPTICLLECTDHAAQVCRPLFSVPENAALLCRAALQRHQTVLRVAVRVAERASSRRRCTWHALARGHPGIQGRRDPSEGVARHGGAAAAVEAAALRVHGRAHEPVGRHHLIQRHRVRPEVRLARLHHHLRRAGAPGIGGPDWAWRVWKPQNPEESSTT